MSRFGGYGRGGPRFSGDQYRQDAQFSENWNQAGSGNWDQSGTGGWPRPGRGRGGYVSQTRPHFTPRNKKYEARFSGDGNSNNVRPRPLLGIAPLMKIGTTGIGGGNKNEIGSVTDSKISLNVKNQQTKSTEVKAGLLPTPTASISSSDTVSSNGDSIATTKSNINPINFQIKQTTTASLLASTTTTSTSTSTGNSSNTAPKKSNLKVSSATSVSQSSSTTVSTSSNVKPSQIKTQDKSSSSEDDDNYCGYCKIKFASSENYSKHTRGLMHTQKVMEVENGKACKEEPKEEPGTSEESPIASGRSSQSFIKQNQKKTPLLKVKNENLKSIFDHKPDGNQKEEYGFRDDGNYQESSDQDYSYDKDPALAKYGLSKELLDTANLELVTKPPKERDLNPEECGKKRFHTDYHCKLCNVKCTGAQSFQAHLAGNKHTTNVETYYQTGKSTVKRTDVSVVLCNRKSLTKELTSVISEPIVGLSYVTEFHKEDAKAVVNCVCNLCESKCDEHTIVPHLMGNRHRLNYMKEHHMEFHDHCKKYGGKKNQTQYIAELTEDIEKIDGKGEPSVKMCVEEKFMEEVYASETLLTTRRPPLLKRPGPAGDKLDGAKRSKVEVYNASENYQGEDYGDYGYNEPVKKGPRQSNDYNEDYGNEQYGDTCYGNEQYGSDQYSNKQYGDDQYSNDQYDHYGNDQYGRNQYGSSDIGRDEYSRGREEPDRSNQDTYLTKEDIYRMDPYSEYSNDGYSNKVPIVKEYGHSKEVPNEYSKSREPLLDEFPQARDQSYGNFSKSREPLIRNPPLADREPLIPEPLLKDPPTHREPLFKNPPVSREPLLNQSPSGLTRKPLLQHAPDQYIQDEPSSWDNGNSQNDYKYSNQDKYGSSYNNIRASRYGGYPPVQNEPPVPPAPPEAPPLPSKSYEEELAEREREEKLIEERIEKEVQNRLQSILSMKKPDADRKSSKSGGMSDMSVLMQSLSNSLISNEDEAEMALQVSNALTQALLKYRLKTLPPEMVRDALPNCGDIVSQLEVSQSPASSKSMKSASATPDTSYLQSQNIPGLMPTNQWPVTSSINQIPMQVDQYNTMSQWSQMVPQGTNYLANQQQPVQSQYMQQQRIPQPLMTTPVPLMSQKPSSGSQPLISSPALIVQHAMGYAKQKQSNLQNQQQFISPLSSAHQMVPPESVDVSSSSNLNAQPNNYYSNVPAEYLHHRLLQGPPGISKPQRRP